MNCTYSGLRLMNCTYSGTTDVLHLQPVVAPVAFFIQGLLQMLVAL